MKQQKIIAERPSGETNFVNDGSAGMHRMESETHHTGDNRGLADSPWMLVTPSSKPEFECRPCDSKPE